MTWLPLLGTLLVRAGTPTADADPASVSVATIDLATIERLVDERLALRGDTAGWDNGFYIQNREHTARLKIGGFTQFDRRFFVPRDSDPKVDQCAFKSIRPDLQGPVFEHSTSACSPTSRAASSSCKTLTRTCTTARR